MEVIYTKEARKNLTKVPKNIYNKFLFWLDMIEYLGIVGMRRHPGFNDEVLAGKRTGQRSVRLSKGYRLFYRELPCEHTLIIEIIEVNKHDY